jgi:cytochrome c
MKHLSFAIISAAALVVALPAKAAGNAEKGRAIYEAHCMDCHSVNFNGVGPAHKGVFGRPNGQAAGYNYSPALKAAKIVWDEESLDRWLTDPAKMVPGQRMGFSLGDAAERADVIAYLKSISPRE